MSLILFLELDNGEEVRIKVEPDDDFQTFLSRARTLIGKDVDISTIVGEEEVCMSDNMYQFMLRAALSNEPGNIPSIEHEIINVSSDNSYEYIVADSLPSSRSDVPKKVLNVEYYKNNTTIDVKKNKSSNNALNNTHCCFCKGSINTQTFPSYIFDQKDQKEMRKSKHKRNRGAAKIVCDPCLQADFVKCTEIPENFDKDSYLILRNNIQYFYKRKPNAQEMAGEDKECSSPQIGPDVGQNGIFYTCRLCSAVLDSLPIAHCLEHISSRFDGLVFPCVLCEYGFTSFDDLKAHMNSTHNAETGSNNKKANLKLTSPEKKKKKCEKGLRLLKELLMKQHGNNKEHSVERSVDIDSTSVKDSESDNESGIWIIQADEDEETIVNEDIATLASEERAPQLRSASTEEDVRYKCDTCKEEFDSMEVFSSHKCVLSAMTDFTEIIVIHRDEINSEPREVKAKVIAVSQADAEEVPAMESRESEVGGQYKCHSCEKTFHTKIRLQFHIRYIHSAASDPATLRCSICPSLAFSSEGALYDHIHFTHPKSKKFRCPVEGCSRQFNIKGVLNNHLSSHSGKRSHGCDACGKLFFDKQTLNEHKVTHLKVKPFQCHICHKYLNRKSRLRMHLLTHQAQPAYSHILACKFCDAAFATASSAQSHLNELGLCTDRPYSEIASQEEFADDPDEMSSSLNDSGLFLDTSDSADRQSGKAADIYELFEEIKQQDYNKKGGESFGDTDSKCKMMDDLGDDARKAIVVVEVDKVFRCEYCESVYWSQESLNLHRENHKEQKDPYSCHVCGARFSTYSRCTTHKTTHGFYRTKTDLSTKTSGRDGDFPIVKYFSCEVCNKTYLHWTYLQVHRKLKHSDSVHMYKCVTCGDEFPNSWGVAYHRKKVHGQSTGSAPPDEVPDTNIERMQYSCPDCGMILSTKAQLFLHRRSSHPTPSSSSSKADMFACSLCGKRYLTKAGLQGHFKKQHEKLNHQTHKCDECNKVFLNFSGLNTHVRRVHMKEIKFKCTECEVGFYSSCDLRSHLRRHSGEKPFPCHLCGKHFRTKGMRNQHVTIHSGERPFKCDICGVGFRRSYALRNHRLTHAPHTRSLQCPICPRLFRLKAELNTHIRHTHCVDPALYNTDKSTNAGIKTLQKSLKDDIVVTNVATTDDKKIEDSYIFSTLFQHRPDDAFMENMEQVQMADTVFNQSEEHSENDEGLLHKAELADTPLCIISGQSLPSGEIVIDSIQNDQYMLDDQTSLMFKDSADQQSKVLQVNGYLTKLVNLNGEIKLMGGEEQEKADLADDHLSHLYGADSVVIDMPIDHNQVKWV